jgi:hypothetical protein
MTEEPLFDAKAPVIDRRRKEWISLDSGRLCVWEMAAADTLFIIEQSVRPGRDRPLVPIAGDAMLWQVVVSCYKGDQPGAERVFQITDLARIQQLRKSEWDRLLAAIERVNATDAAEVERLQDFTPAAPGGNRR